MNPSKLQEIIEPLEDLLKKNDFRIDEEPMVEGAIRMAIFEREDGVVVDYTFEVIKDNDKGPFKSDSEVDLNVRLYKDGEAIPLVDNTPMESNMSVTETVKDMIEGEIKPNLMKYL